MKTKKRSKITEKYTLWYRKGLRLWEYATVGVWHDRRNSLFVRAVKTVNLTVKSFLSTDLQSTACALTYRLILALVPALALIFAIGRGFGFQNLLESQLFNYFPSQRQALETGIKFVDSYLAQASEGIFVGVGIVVLLWTLISLIGAVEDAFNQIWGVKHGRTIWRKITDYTAIFLILPVLMVCGSGLTAFMSSSVENYLPFMTPVVSVALDLASVLLIWFFFTGVYMLIPNTKVKFKNAFPAGIMAGIAFQVLQWLFVSGQIYVSKYNAIYGGFAFLPLLLIWLQLVWLFTLSGALICYAAQSVTDYALESDVFGISFNYRTRIGLGILAVVNRRYQEGLKPLTAVDMQKTFTIPLRLISLLLQEMEDLKLVCRVLPTSNPELIAYQPAKDLSALTVGQVMTAFRRHGTHDFVKEFDNEFASLNEMLNTLELNDENAASTLISELEIPQKALSIRT
ncbi:MAG: YihY/virulence factor BrkB family protein [Bacteroidales bacterium]|nr:YihY/virulence factor BrkB family protein [Bacteroidales bacterium]MBD5293986.1 YihY/virulence factor BrkB family protein [Bacteroides sp.]MDE6032406.1 YihY/virulence factor BrkB family protein [Muribaculaceae bacterium]MBD5353159.1 YihY/virulence factor BrkB family protein [Bacteroides sp.]MBD5359934.1 YihY/virulence factor BrkB family protein [Bacteroides sp.]